MGVAGMSVPERVKATVRVFKSAVCVWLLAVIPVAIVIVHSALAGKSAPPTVSASDAVAAPGLLPAGVNVVLPQPVVEGVPGVASILNRGKTSVMSSVATSGVFDANLNEMAPTPPVTALAISRELLKNAGTTIAGEVSIVDIEISV